MSYLYHNFVHLLLSPIIMELTSGLDSVKKRLISYIRTHKLASGAQLPSEAALAKELGISRNSLREAYISLEAAGIIIRRHGLGTFVSRAPIIEALDTGFVSFPGRIKAAGYTPGFRSLSLAFVNASPDVYEALNIAPSIKLFRVERVILADEAPAVYLNDYFSPTLKADTFDWRAFDGEMVPYINRHASVELNGGQLHSKIRAIAGDERITNYLELAGRTPIIKYLSTVYTFYDEPIVLTEAYLNPNVIELDVLRIIRA